MKTTPDPRFNILTINESLKTGGSMPKNKKGFWLRSITLVCVLALIGIVANADRMVKSEDRLIQLEGSPAKVLLKGNESYRISLDGKSYSRDFPIKKEIRLRGFTFDPLLNPPRFDRLSGVKKAAIGGVRLYIVQCVTQAIVPYQEQVTAAGGEICGTLPDHALVVLMPAGVKANVERMPFVRWVGHYDAALKLEQEINNNLSGTSAVNPNRFSLWLVKKNKRDAVAAYIDSIGGVVKLKGKGRRMEADLDQNQLNQVASHAFVQYVDRWTPKEDDMNIVRDITGANYVETMQGYSGQGVRAEVCDGGLRTTHQDFQANPPLIHGGNSSSTSHGTPVTGIVFGSGAANANARGMIPDAEQPIFACYNCFSDRYTHTQELVNPVGPYRAVFQTNSWGNTRTFFYTTISAEMDEIIFDLDILITQSQSNAGNQDSRPQAWAKNILSVGGFRHYDTIGTGDDCWCSSASIGPADDGRIKPDLWHFYDYTLAPYYTSDTSYTQFGGTSGATPITAGHFGLLFQMWGDGVFAGGPGQARDVFNVRPHFSTAKALMIHSAWQFPFSGTSHDKTRMHQGWGMPNVQTLYDMAEAHNWGFPILIDETAVIAPLQTHTYNLTVDGAQPLRATLVYSDPAGVPNTNPNRVNDLTLKVTSPSATVYWGNVGLDVGNWSTAGGSPNTIDTVENVFIQNPEAGTWTIEVLADEVVQDGHVETGAIDADYALVASGGTTGTVDPPAAPSALSATTIACDQIDLAWTDNSSDETSFKIERSTDGVNFGQIDTVGADVTSYSDTTVAESTTYWYRVRAANSGGNSAYSNTDNATTPACPLNPPAAPTGLTANAAACDQIDLAWTDNANNETSFTIERGTDGVNFNVLDTVGANVTSYSDTTVAENTTYYYRVKASNGDGDSAYSNIASDTTPVCPVNPPTAPSNLRAKAKGKSKISLSWNDNSNNETGFKIYRDSVLIATVGANTTAFDDTTVSSKTTYTYQVCAYNGDGETCSNTASATTK
jgi:hypothetical protein